MAWRVADRRLSRVGTREAPVQGGPGQGRHLERCSMEDWAQRQDWGRSGSVRPVEGGLEGRVREELPGGGSGESGGTPVQFLFR